MKRIPFKVTKSIVCYKGKAIKRKGEINGGRVKVIPYHVLINRLQTF